MYKNLRNQSGFSIIELLIVIALLAIVATFSIMSFIEYRDFQASRATVVDINSLIKETKQKTISAETTGQFGLYFSTSSLTVFEGSVYSPTGINNKVYIFPNTNLKTNFSDSSNQIVFSRLTGEASATGTIDVGSVRLNSTTTITILGSGLIE